MKKALLALGLLVISGSLFAQSNAMGQNDSDAPLAPLALVKHVLKGTYISTGAFGAVGAGFTAIDAVSNVTCPGTSGNCLIQADQWIQAGASSASNNSVAICLYVDGSSVDGCFFNGDTLVNSHYTQFSTSHGITVPHGVHTVQTVFFTSAGATVPFYNATYRVYKP